MVGRYANRYTWRQIKELYDLTAPYLEPDCRPRTNIAPTQGSLVVRLNEQGGRELAELKWGLIPSGWDEKIRITTFNAKCETVHKKPAFCEAFKLRPCLVVADGFYEWKKAPVTKKKQLSREKEKNQPYFITRANGKLFAFAGIWEAWYPANGSPFPWHETFSILTCPPNKFCAKIHNRMPVMLAPENFALWLGSVEDRKKLMRPFPDDEMVMWKVGHGVGNARNTGLDLADPIPDEPEKQSELF